MTKACLRRFTYNCCGSAMYRAGGQEGPCDQADKELYHGSGRCRLCIQCGCSSKGSEKPAQLLILAMQSRKRVRVVRIGFTAALICQVCGRCLSSSQDRLHLFACLCDLLHRSRPVLQRKLKPESSRLGNRYPLLPCSWNKSMQKSRCTLLIEHVAMLLHSQAS